MSELVYSPEEPTPASTRADRLRYIISRLSKSQAQFSQMVGVDPGYLSKVLSGRIPVSDALINRLVVDLGVTKEWLADGRGVPFAKPQRHESHHTRGAAVYDIDVTAGVTPLSQMFTTDRIVGYLAMPDINPDCPVVRVNGDSMTPDVPDGSLISIREIYDASVIAWGAIYVVQLSDYRMVKVLRRHSDPDKIILHSFNPDYDDIEVERRKVLKLFLVEKVITCRALA